MQSPVRMLVSFVILVGLGYLTFRVISSTARVLPSCPRCNVILISNDALSAKHLETYGYDKPTSPLLKELSEERGIVFERAIAQAPWTLPSHTAMFTGRYPSEFGIWLPTDKLTQDAKTIAETLQERGYQTHAISPGIFVQPEWGLDQGFATFEGTIDRPPDGDHVPAIFDQGLAWIEQQTQEPFFLFLHSWHVNSPYTPSDEALAAIGVQDVPDVFFPNIVQVNTKPGGATDQDNEQFRIAYDAEVRELDTAFADFLGKLDASEVGENTVVIFTSDHGEEFGEHGLTGFHAQLYDETIRVPLIYFFPGGKGKRVPGAVEIRGIPSSILKLAGLDPEPVFEAPAHQEASKQAPADLVARSAALLGRHNIFDILRKYATTIGRTIHPTERTAPLTEPYAASAQSMVWQIIRNFDGTHELYNLLEDPEELSNRFPEWSSLPTEQRREALKIIDVLGGDVPVPCGLYCSGEENAQ